MSIKITKFIMSVDDLKQCNPDDIVACADGSVYASNGKKWFRFTMDLDFKMEIKND